MTAADQSIFVAKRRETAYTNKLFRVVAERPLPFHPNGRSAQLP